MEKRIGVISIVISNKTSIEIVNNTISQFSDYILSRQGLPLRDKGLSIITLIIESTTDSINSLNGSLGRIEGVEAKAILSKIKQVQE